MHSTHCTMLDVPDVEWSCSSSTFFLPLSVELPLCSSCPFRSFGGGRLLPHLPPSFLLPFISAEFSSNLDFYSTSTNRTTHWSTNRTTHWSTNRTTHRSANRTTHWSTNRTTHRSTPAEFSSNLDFYSTSSSSDSFFTTIRIPPPLLSPAAVPCSFELFFFFLSFDLVQTFTNKITSPQVLSNSCCLSCLSYLSVYRIYPVHSGPVQ
jgi:hypothetical protein